MSKLILLVDDDPIVLDVVRGCLRAEYQVRLSTQGSKALELARLDPMPDLILLDVSLPDVNGYELCAALKRDPLTAEIPVIFLTSHSDMDNVIRGLELGAVDYVSKPVRTPVLLARIRTHLRLREAGELLRDQNLILEQKVLERTHELDLRTVQLQARTLELQLSQDLTIVALGSVAETRDNETGNHIYRTRGFVRALTQRLASSARYRDRLGEEQWAMIWKSSPLHDIGKVGISDDILLKPGKLTEAEFFVMKRHSEIGRDALLQAEARMGYQGSYLEIAKEIAIAHHERWDGSGYPYGLAGEAIPLSARLMALADVYDAMTSRRVYKPALPHATAVDEIRRGRGTHFDPFVVDCFLDNPVEFMEISARFADDVGEKTSETMK